MRKTIVTVSIILSILLLLSGCQQAAETEPSPLPNEEATESPAYELTPPPATPTPPPRTAEDVLPPIEKDIFEGRDDFVYAQSFSAGPAGLSVIMVDGSVLSRGENMIGPLSDHDAKGFGLTFNMPDDRDMISPDANRFGKLLNTEDNYVFISCEQFDTFAIDENDVLWSWGMSPWWGNITGVKPGDLSPYRLLTDVQMASTSAGTYLALRKDGSVWMWGDGSNGQLGAGADYNKYDSRFPLTEPVKVLEDCVYADISGGRCYAIKEDASLWIWGKMGSTGSTPETYKSYCYDRPKHIMDDVKYAYGCFIVKNDGTLWALNSHWNDRYDRQTYYPEDPVKIMENVKYAKGGLRYMAIKTDGSLWVWGDNLYGALGLGEEDYITEPTKLMDNVIWVDSEAYGIYILKENGELWGAGQLTGERELTADIENPPTEEELRQRRLPRKLLSGVKVGSYS